MTLECLIHINKLLFDKLKIQVEEQPHSIVSGQYFAILYKINELTFVLDVGKVITNNDGDTSSPSSLQGAVFNLIKAITNQTSVLRSLHHMNSKLVTMNF